jgi:hypothetical protein
VLNIYQRVAQVTRRRRRGHPCAISGGPRLTAPQARSIRQRLARHELHEAIAADFNVSVSAISNIATGRTWAHLDAEPLGEDTGNRSPESHP